MTFGWNKKNPTKYDTDWLYEPFLSCIFSKFDYTFYQNSILSSFWRDWFWVTFCWKCCLSDVLLKFDSEIYFIEMWFELTFCGSPILKDFLSKLIPSDFSFNHRFWMTFCLKTESKWLFVENHFWVSFRRTFSLSDSLIKFDSE